MYICTQECRLFCLQDVAAVSAGTVLNGGEKVAVASVCCPARNNNETKRHAHGSNDPTAHSSM
jgi:hypothetical protein